MKRFGIAVLALALGLALAGCTSKAFDGAIFAKAKALQIAPEYQIEAGDNLTIRVLGPDDLGENIVTGPVRPDGKLAFPRHGDIAVEGKTSEELRKELEASFEETLGIKNPRVYVAVNRFDSKNVTVLGEVNNRGRFPYRGQMRVADLLGLTQGTRYIFSAPNRALLFRELDGVTKAYHVHLKKMVYDNDWTTNFYVRPGDILWVPPNGFAETYYAIRKVMLPIEALFSAVGLGSSTVNYFTPVAGAG